MSNNLDELKLLITELVGKATSFSGEARKITDVCAVINRAWSGSSLIGHAKYFFDDFREPSSGERFSIEWGLINGEPDGWAEIGDDEIREKIEADSGVSLNTAEDLASELENGFLDVQREAVLFLSENGFQDADIDKIENYSMKSKTEIFNSIFPTKFFTRDTHSATSHYIAPHIYYDATARFIVQFPIEMKGFLFELEKLSRKKLVPKVTASSESKKSQYVESSIILGLSELKSEKFDLTKLIQLSKELNDNYSLGNYLACAMLIRAILDHVPPIFEKKTFSEAANNYGTKSFRDIMLPLENTARKISDSFLHNPIRKKEMLPTLMQVSFQPNLETLLSEIIRVLGTEQK